LKVRGRSDIEWSKCRDHGRRGKDTHARLLFQGVKIESGHIDRRIVGQFVVSDVVWGHARAFGDFDESLMCYGDLASNVVDLGSLAPIGLDPDEHGYLLAQVVKLNRAR